MHYLNRRIDETFLSTAKRHTFYHDFRDLDYDERAKLIDAFYGAISVNEKIEKVYEHFTCLLELRRKLENRHVLRRIAFL